MRKQVLISTLIIAVLSICLVGIALIWINDLGRHKIEVRELYEELNCARENLESIRKDYPDLEQIYLDTGMKPPIETQLGVKLMDNGLRFGEFYLWITGNVKNNGNRTAYHVRLLFTLYTDNGTMIKDVVIGTLEAFETVSVRLTIWTEIGTIVDWKIDPVASYKP